MAALKLPYWQRKYVEGNVLDLFRRLREALALSDEIAALRHDAAMLRSEWADVLDMLKAREERMRKRDRARIKRGDVEEEESEAASDAMPVTTKDDLRIVARRMGKIR